MSFPKLSIVQILSLFTILVMVVTSVLVFSSELFEVALPGWRRYAFGAIIGLYAVVRSRRIIKQLKS